MRLISIPRSTRMRRICPEEYGAAAEAALGDARFALLVEPEQEALAIELAREQRFAGPVYAGARVASDEVAGALRLGADAPAWLRQWSERVTLHADGTWSDERGIWVAGGDQRVIGSVGRKVALDRAKAELEFVRAAVTSAATEFTSQRRSRRVFVSAWTTW